MKAKIRRCFAVIMTAIVLFGGIPDTVFAKGLEGERQNRSEERRVGKECRL